MSWYSRAFNLLRSNRVSRDIDREMSFHVAEAADDLINIGMTPAEAEREAKRRFGHRSALHETTRDADVLTWLESCITDVRQATRMLRASPGFTFVAVLSLALGIGANTAIFSLINAVMLKSLPVQEPEALVSVSSGQFGAVFSNPLWESFRQRQTALANVAAFSPVSFTLNDGGEVRRIVGNWVSGDFFTTLGVRPEVGRLLQASDDTRGCAPVAVLSDSYWQSAYGGRADIVGGAITLNKIPFTVVGITPPEFFGAAIGSKQQIYAPLCAMVAVGGGETLDSKSRWFLSVIGRLKPLQTRERAQLELTSIAETVLQEGMAADQFTDMQKDKVLAAFRLQSGVGEFSEVRRDYSQALVVLMVVVGLVLVIGCANVANLLMARAANRQREIAVRFALGASRWRVVRQLMTETLLLATAGAAVGLIFARWSTGLLIALLGSSSDPVNIDVPIDMAVFSFTMAVAVGTALLFGIAPAWNSTRANPQEAMRAQARGIVGGHSRFSWARALVVGQIALSMILVAGAGLLLGTFRTLSTLDLGFKPDNVLLVRASFGTDDGADEQHIVPMRFKERLRAIPGVLAVSASNGTPVSGGTWNGGIAVEGFVSRERGDAMVYLTQVTGDYFETMGMPLLLGRAFDARDALNAQKVAIISQTTAERYFGQGNPVGRVFHMPERTSEGPAYEVVGVVPDSKYRSVKEAPTPLVFFPVSQAGPELSGGWNFEVRTSASASGSLIPQVTAAAAEINPRIALSYTMLETQVAASLTRERLLATLSSFFGVLALLLAVIGLYGTMSYGVSRRRNEIGIRLALGAERIGVLRMVLGDVTRIVAIGLLIGVAGAMVASRYVASFLFGVQPNDVATLAVAVVVLAISALAAGAIPAWRAARLDPMLALRED